MHDTMFLCHGFSLNSRHNTLLVLKLCSRLQRLHFSFEGAESWFLPFQYQLVCCDPTNCITLSKPRVLDD